MIIRVLEKKIHGKTEFVVECEDARKQGFFNKDFRTTETFGPYTNENHATAAAEKIAADYRESTLQVSVLKEIAI